MGTYTIGQDVELLRVEDEAAAALVIARAFVDNPGMVAVLDSDDAARRLALLSRLFPVFVAAYRKHGAAFIARDDSGAITGVALTLPPGRYPQSVAMQVQLTLGVIARMPLGVALRLGIADALMRKHHMTGAHHYLFMLGVDPDHQGRGYGSVLLRELSRRADDAHVPCYLETDKPSSMKLYERHGYRITHERTFRRLSDLKLWFMQRPE